ncbi:MAG: endonuclease mitochondrial [Campylobacterota bacterium]|nr:endonuclease mitochondrial [Campylobacterota bacterium]
MKKKLLSLLIKKPVIIILVGFIACLVYSYEYFIARPQMVYMGIPKTNESSTKTFTRIFRNDGFMVGYSDVRGNPLWVSYKLTKIPPSSKNLKRPQGFNRDWRAFGLVSHDSYTNSRYDRGHMAPNHAISRLYGEDAQHDTFLMTNITPQKPKLNQRVWQKLEILEIQKFIRLFDEVWVYTGPIFDDDVKRLNTSFFVEIPDGFYKIYIGLNKNELPKTLAFNIPQTVKGYENPYNFITTIKEIETLSGFDFFHELDDNLENEIENNITKESWGIN